MHTWTLVKGIAGGQTVDEMNIDFVRTTRDRFEGRARLSGNADVLVGIYIRADGDVGVPGKTRTPI
ncbi:MAG TPA: hypothetical protein VFC46_16065 [Humisphaera sp.]|nr:hypothetical protein [Humisphaera sp.]